MFSYSAQISSSVDFRLLGTKFLFALAITFSLNLPLPSSTHSFFLYQWPGLCSSVLQSILAIIIISLYISPSLSLCFYFVVQQINHSVPSQHFHSVSHTASFSQGRQSRLK